eukprot:SM002745S10002  [mRNA]  locus=s2745:207:1180:+ [translate_table: standard]
MFIAIPSFALLYSMDEVVDPAITIKAIGHQWYWSYEYSDYNISDEQSLAFDSYMIPEDDLEYVPGRLNQTSIFIKREGVYYGQCSELCGTNHGFMPIVVEAVSLDDYVSWHGLRYGMILFIISEVMFFLAFFWAFFHSSLAPSVEIGAIWPPKGIEVLDPWGIPFLNTVILLSSGAAVTWAHHSILAGMKDQAI